MTLCDLPCAHAIPDDLLFFTHDPQPARFLLSQSRTPTSLVHVTDKRVCSRQPKRRNHAVLESPATPG